jgi:putative ATPase
MKRPYEPAADLFDVPKREGAANAPLAERMRPQSFDDLAGQEEIVGKGKSLRSAIEADRLSSVIIWGPPGCGKTTLAHLISRSTKAHFVAFSAVTSGIPELREILKGAEHRLRTSGQKTILFVDEIHRFNKAQQDAFLPHVEKGTIILVGAVLRPLNDEALERILDRALTDADRGLGGRRIQIDQDARRRLIGFANGDGRSLLMALEFVAEQAVPQPDGSRRLDDATVEAALLKKTLRYDKSGEEHYNVISAYIKSLRDSDPDGAVYWLARMLEAGEDPKFIARRLVIFASEDVGNADPLGIVVAAAVAQAVQFVGLPEAQINLAHGTTFLATRPKDNASYIALLEALSDARAGGNLGVPLHLRNAVTSMMRDLGYGKGYRYVHDDPQAQREQEHLPEALKGRKYYKPKGK